MRTLIAGIVGLVAATALVAILGVAFKQQAFLAILFGGLAAGLLMRMLAAGSGSMYARGALAAVATAAAAVLGPMAATQWFTAQGKSIPAPPPSAVVAAADDDAEADDAPAEPAPAPVEMTPVGDEIASSPYAPRNAKTSFAGAEIACMVFGCLIAYQLGKGEGAARAVPVDENPETPAEEEPAKDPATQPPQGE